MHTCQYPLIWTHLALRTTCCASVGTATCAGSYIPARMQATHHPPGSEARKYLQNTIIHRDLKPENTMLSRQGLHTLADLGLSKTYEKTPGEEYAMTGETGTVLYMAPEVMRSDDYDGKVDVLSCAVML